MEARAGEAKGKPVDMGDSQQVSTIETVELAAERVKASLPGSTAVAQGLCSPEDAVYCGAFKAFSFFGLPQRQTLFGKWGRTYSTHVLAASRGFHDTCCPASVFRYITHVSPHSIITLRISLSPAYLCFHYPTATQLSKKGCP